MFDEVKKSPNLLVHFDGDKPIVLACDASPYGVGAVLSHHMEDGTDRPIVFASRTLASGIARGGALGAAPFVN